MQVSFFTGAFFLVIFFLSVIDGLFVFFCLCFADFVLCLLIVGCGIVSDPCLPLGFSGIGLLL